MWQAGPFILVYQNRTNGFRALEVLPSIFSEAAKDHAQELGDSLRDSCDILNYEATELAWIDENKS